MSIAVLEFFLNFSYGQIVPMEHIMQVMLTPEDIKRIRRELKLSARQFADRLGVTMSTVFKWESGLRHPTYKMMGRLNSMAAGNVRTKQPA